MSIQEMQQELTSLRTRLTRYRNQSLSADDDTPRVLDDSELARIREFEAMISTMEGQLREHRTAAESRQSSGANRGEASAVNISHSVQLIPQPTNLSCWAAGIAMMVSWKGSVSISPETIAEALGYQIGNVLHPEDTAAFQRWGMSWESPVCYTVQGFADLLRRGTLWIASDVGEAHVRVVHGISGDGTPDGTQVFINDPWPVNSGASYTRTFRTLAQEMEGLGEDELSFARPIYVATI
jgi:hypothetical protein